jgi:hypothetical protein
MQIYFIESGEVEIVVVAPIELGASHHNTKDINATAATQAQAQNSAHTDNVSVVRVNKVHAGGAFGEADFLLGRQHRYVSVWTRSGSFVWCVVWVCGVSHKLCLVCAALYSDAQNRFNVNHHV